jgi:hypothetical protein
MLVLHPLKARQRPALRVVLAALGLLSLSVFPDLANNYWQCLAVAKTVPFPRLEYALVFLGYTLVALICMLCLASDVKDWISCRVFRPGGFIAEQADPQSVWAAERMARLEIKQRAALVVELRAARKNDSYPFLLIRNFLGYFPIAFCALVSYRLWDCQRCPFPKDWTAESQSIGVHLCQWFSPELVSVAPVILAVFGLETYRPFLQVWPIRGWDYRYLQRMGIFERIDPEGEPDQKATDDS